MKRFLKAINNYVVFFLTVAFAVSCCMMLFLNTLAKTMGIEFTQHNIAAAAKVTFWNVLLITLLFGTFDYIRRKLLVERPTKKSPIPPKKSCRGILQRAFRQCTEVPWRALIASAVPSTRWRRSFPAWRPYGRILSLMCLMR